MTSPENRWSLLRLRQSTHLRELTSETTFTTGNLIQPLFVVDGLGRAEPIAGMEDNSRVSVGDAGELAARDVDAGVRHFLLFTVPSAKTTSGLKFDHVARAVASVKKSVGDRACVWIDICLCASTAHGHCAILDQHGKIDLAPTLDALGEMAVTAAKAGADGVSPSDMMDGRTAHLRHARDAGGFAHVPIMSYSTKFASNFYGPFRGAAGSAPAFGDRRHYQIDVRSRTDAIASSERCAAEGADLLMVKPGLTSLDLIAPIRETTGKLVGAYQVSGEYAGLRALAAQNLINLDAGLLETWHVFRRAGAAFIISYAARRAHAIGFPG